MLASFCVLCGAVQGRCRALNGLPAAPHPSQHRWTAQNSKTYAYGLLWVDIPCVRGRWGARTNARAFVVRVREGSGGGPNTNAERHFTNAPRTPRTTTPPPHAQTDNAMVFRAPINVLDARRQAAGCGLRCSWRARSYRLITPLHAAKQLLTELPHRADANAASDEQNRRVRFPPTRRAALGRVSQSRALRTARRT